MYCHYKGRQSSPRQDLYLIGPPSGLSSRVLTEPDLTIFIQDPFTQNVFVPFPSSCPTPYGS
jgi:hypothetical protein